MLCGTLPLTRPFYTAYGLDIASALALPELALEAAAEGRAAWPGAAPDVTIEMGAALAPGSFEAACESLRADRELGELAWRGVGRFRLQRGRWVRAEPQAGVAQETLRAFLLGPVLATLLFQRGFLVLHASAVALPEASGAWGAVAFLGRSGEGKSTMAACLHARGCPIVADDYIAVPPLGASTRHSPPREAVQATAGSTSCADNLEAAAHPLLFPGYAQLSLLPASLAALGEKAEPEPRPRSPQHPKLAQRLAQGFSTLKLPLRRVYVLEAGDEVRIRTLPPARSVVELARHSYCTSLLLPGENAVQFQHCGGLAGAVSVRSLRRPRDLARLEEVAQAVQADQEA